MAGQSTVLAEGLSDALPPSSTHLTSASVTKADFRLLVNELSKLGEDRSHAPGVSGLSLLPL